MSKEEYVEGLRFVEKHFKIIKAQEKLYNYKDILNLSKIARDKDEYFFTFIDPYNSLKTDLSGFSKLSTHEYHYEAISEIKAYGQQTKHSIWINHHAVTSAIRQKDETKKYAIAPRKEDTEGGGKMANKADDFLTYHRVTNHPTDWMNTEIHVRKIRDTETGGKMTFADEPVLLERYNNGYSYREKNYMGQYGIDPVEEWRYKKNGFITERGIIQDLWKPLDNTDNDITF